MIYIRFIKGAGLFASGPYFCTRGTIMTVADCMTTGISIYTDQLILAAKAYEELGLIDSMSNLAESRVFIYSGESDYIVWPGVVKKNEEFFRKLGSHIKSDYSIKSVHCMPTDFYGNECSHLGDPYINNCNYNGAKISLDHIMGTTLKTGIKFKDSSLKSFSQKEYNPGISSSFGDTGYIYVPEGCVKAECPLHVVFHGCHQTIKDIGLDYVKNTGYLEIAEANNIIMLFPQLKSSILYPLNPQGCWDWWGYSEVVPLPLSWSFPTNSGTQMKLVHRMIKDVQNGKLKIDSEFQFDGIELISS